MDIWTKEKRSEVMSRILSKNTKPEKLVRSMLHSMGYRFRINMRNLPGKPDIVLNKYNAIIFVHGCFWHLHEGCREGRIPSTRIKYWTDKLLKNKERDKKHTKVLKRQGWKVLRVWECQIEKTPQKVIKKIVKLLTDS